MAIFHHIIYNSTVKVRRNGQNFLMKFKGLDSCDIWVAQLSRSRSCSPDRLPEKRENNRDQIEEKSKTDRDRAIIAFKFALVVYLKDLLKPYWKEEKLSKDAYKMILKKSVYKVIQSFGDSEVPSKRKTNAYLTASHSKLSKLVQAYVEKYQKV